MKGINLILMYMCLFALCVFGAFATASVQDNFNRANSATLGTATNSNTWVEDTETSGTASINNNEALLSGGDGSGEILAHLPVDITTPNNISVEIKWDWSTVTANENVYFYTNDGTNFGIYCLLYGVNGKRLYCYQEVGGWTDTGFTPTDNTYHNYTFKNIDYSNHDFDIYVDGSLEHSGMSFYSSSTNTFTNVYIRSRDSNTGEYAYFDNILFNSGIAEAPPVSNEYINISNITINNVSVVNNTWYNISPINISLTLQNVSTNTNINTSMNFTFIEPKYLIGGVYYPLYHDTASRNQFCLEMVNGTETFYSSSNVGPDPAKAQYNGTDWEALNFSFQVDKIICSKQIGTNTLYPNTTLYIDNNIYSSLYNITFNATNNETSINQTITIGFDFIAPVITQIANVSSGIFEQNFTDIISVDEINLDSCLINITELENVTTPDNFLINCTDTQSFNTSGLHNALVTATDLAGNIGTLSFNFTIQPFIYIRFNDSDTNTSITNYNVTIYHPDSRETIQSDVDGVITLSPVNDGELDLGVHYIEFNKFGYLIANATYNVTEDSANQNVTFTIPGAKIVVTIYNIDDYTLINDSETTIEIIGDSFSSIFTTSNGTLNISSILMQDETYSVIVSNVNYETSTYYFNYNNQEVLELPIYLTPLELNDTLIADLIINVVDDYQKPLRSINVISYVWDSSQSKYVQTNLKATDYDGQTSFKVFLNTKLYNFCAEYLGVLYCEEDLSININTQEVTIEIPISEIALPDEETIYDIDFSYSLQSLDLGNNYTSVTFTYNNPNQDVDEYCLKIYEIVKLNRVLRVNQCDTSHSAALSANVLNNDSKNYVAFATIEVDGKVRELEDLYLYGRTDLQEQLLSYGLVKLILIVLVGGIIGLSIHKRVHDISIAHIGLPIVFFFASIFFDEYISAESFVLVLIANFFAWKIITKKDDLNKEAGYNTMVSILLIYMVFIFGLFVALTEMDNKGLLDEYGENILNNINEDNTGFKTYIDSTTDNLKNKRADANIGAWELLTAIFLKTLEFVDLFFTILSNLFNIVSNIILILGVKNSLLIQISKVLDLGVVSAVIYLYFKEAFK